MYRALFELRDPPLRPSPDARFLYMTAQVRKAPACLQYGIATRKGFETELPEISLPSAITENVEPIDEVVGAAREPEP